MNENLDLIKILKDCPKGWKLWSPLFGKVEFVECDLLYQIVVSKEDKLYYFTPQGSFIFRIKYRVAGECVLFPSEDQRDWNKFIAPWHKKDKFDPKTLHLNDKVLVKDTDSWDVSSFALYNEMDKVCICSAFGSYKCCIPYNDDTKHLIGTNDEAPEYYRYWLE